MANYCYFEMKITGREEAVNELVQMLKWEGPFKEKGLGRVFSFEENSIDRDPKYPGFLTVTGHGDCAWSLLCAMMDYKDRHPSLESETKRLGLVVEAYSSEPGCCFQEHILVNHGELEIDDSVDYTEYWIEDKTEEEKLEICEELGISLEELENGTNCNGDYCVGGYGDEFGDFEDHFKYLLVLPEQIFNKTPESNPSKTYSYLNGFGSTFEVKPVIGMYNLHNNFAFGLHCFDKELGAWTPYSIVTVNVSKLPYLQSAIDTSSIDGKQAIEFLEKNGFAKDTDYCVLRGNMTFPVYEFNEEKMKEIDPDTFAEYAKANGRSTEPKLSLSAVVDSAKERTVESVNTHNNKDFVR